MAYDAMDQTIGKANRMIEEMGFHWWSCYVCRDTEGRLMLGFSLIMATTKNTCLTSDVAVYLDESAETLRDRLSFAELRMRECANEEGVQLAECSRAEVRLPWSESLRFAPEFFVKRETADLCVHH